ncbi:hypothetical protein CLCR_11424 [Cladophialophora carrionii]|uniref:Uncharacterized protein n=1 Tax=Cladophialophora carrionii TaxID=86049 RepID=A0A1C1CY84_9EURO|nr:hypothetical protein CLCR_11424 [Cladophialophora carrionii]
MESNSAKSVTATDTVMRLLVCLVWFVDGRLMMSIGSTSWGGVKRIASDIDGLMRTANGLGWEQHNDQEFERLNLSKVFDSAEAPQQIVDYLEDKVRSLRHENPLPSEHQEPKIIEQAPR